MAVRTLIRIVAVCGLVGALAACASTTPPPEVAMNPQQSLAERQATFNQVRLAVRQGFPENVFMIGEERAEYAYSALVPQFEQYATLDALREPVETKRLIGNIIWIATPVLAAATTVPFLLKSEEMTTSLKIAVPLLALGVLAMGGFAGWLAHSAAYDDQIKLVRQYNGILRQQLGLESGAEVLPPTQDYGPADSLPPATFGFSWATSF
jgi:hypothetical protein